MSATRTDIVIVGAGHAGCEAAAAAARMGVEVVVVTLHRETIAQMPCNPAMGGIGKGHLIAELDAIGGLQGWATDRAGIQFKTLNRSRGPAVWGPRAQCDKERYSNLMRRVLSRLRGVSVVVDEVEGLLVEKGRVVGVSLVGGHEISARAVVLSTGTFLGGLLHTGEERKPGGRFGERPSTGLGRELERLGFELRRFKTGTPPRLNRESIDVSKFEVQNGDSEPRAFSWRTRAVSNKCVCWMTRTSSQIQTIVGENLDRSPLFEGTIQGVGPRYCPSIEDKVVRFPHHQQHTIFLEPEGLESNSIYVNGLSTSLPRDVQEKIVRAIPGLENAEFIRYGYAVEYDVVAPKQVKPNLESSSVPGLYFAGQLLGTSGYEEAAALGILAGINAAGSLRGGEEFIPGREMAYLGVLVADVAGKEHREPYRMFTSRAEHRLILGVDSARERLMAEGLRLGLVSETAFHVEHERWQRRLRARSDLESLHLNPDKHTCAEVRALAGIEISSPTTWAGILRRQDVQAEAIVSTLPATRDLSAEDRRIVVGLLRYDGYLVRNERERERLQKLRNIPIPTDLFANVVPGLSREIMETLAEERPRTLAEAEDLPGVTPAALALLAGVIARRRG